MPPSRSAAEAPRLLVTGACGGSKSRRGRSPSRRRGAERVVRRRRSRPPPRGARAFSEARSGGCQAPPQARRRAARAFRAARSRLSSEGSHAAWRDPPHAAWRVVPSSPGRLRSGCFCLAQCAAGAGGQSRRSVSGCDAQRAAGAPRAHSAPRGAGCRAREVTPLGVIRRTRLRVWCRARRAGCGPAVSVSRNAQRARAARAAVLFPGAMRSERRRAARAFRAARCGLSSEGSHAAWRDPPHAASRVVPSSPGRLRSGCFCLAQCAAGAGGQSRRSVSGCDAQRAPSRSARIPRRAVRVVERGKSRRLA